ncbi:MAG: spore coat associated protein CotJA [Oscillospiraceae bacterium]
MMQMYNAGAHSDEMAVFPALILLASSYTPFQSWEEPLDAQAALEAGTVFPSLVMPFMMGYGCNGCAGAQSMQEKGEWTWR